jgi:predicted nucleotidyltransferase
LRKKGHNRSKCILRIASSIVFNVTIIYVERIDAYDNLGRRTTIAVAGSAALGVQRLEVVGSAARSDDFDPATSDVDFLVDVRTGCGVGALEQFFGLRDALAEVLGRRST